MVNVIYYLGDLKNEELVFYRESLENEFIRLLNVSKSFKRKGNFIKAVMAVQREIIKCECEIYYRKCYHPNKAT